MKIFDNMDRSYSHRLSIYVMICYLVSCVSSSKFEGSNYTQLENCGKIPTNPSDVPWKAILIKKLARNEDYTCFGTIISPRLILSAEMCIYQSPPNQKFVISADPSDYEIVLNKIPRSQKSFQVREFYIYNKTGPISDANRFHEVLIIVLEERITFNSDVSPACVQWSNPSPVNVWNGTATVVTGQKIAPGLKSKEEPTIQNFSLASHAACKEKWTYPYFVFQWACFLHNNGKKTEETFLHKEDLFCLVSSQKQLQSYTVGSGVMIEDDHRVFIRGISGYSFNMEPYLSSGSKFKSVKSFLNEVQDIIANLSRSDGESINGTYHSQTNSEEEPYSRTFVNLLENHTELVDDSSKNPQKLTGVIDIAGYINWIKKVRDENDP